MPRVGRDPVAGDRLLAVTVRAEQLKVVGVVDVSVDRPGDVVDLGSLAAAVLAAASVSFDDLLTLLSRQLALVTGGIRRR